MRRLPRRSWIWSRPARFRWMSQKSFKFAVVLKISVRHDGAARGRGVPGGSANDTSRAAASTSESICTIGEKSKNPSIFDQIVSLAAVSAESQHDSGVVPTVVPGILAISARYARWARLSNKGPTDIRDGRSVRRRHRSRFMAQTVPKGDANEITEYHRPCMDSRLVHYFGVIASHFPLRTVHSRYLMALMIHTVPYL